jgi:hypothetical protein
MTTSKRAVIEWPPLLIVARYLVTVEHGKFKRGSICFLVENSEGTRYQVTLQRSGASCSCPARRRRCYHIDQCIELHNKRVAARKQRVEMEAILEEAESLAS